MVLCNMWIGNLMGFCGVILLIGVLSCGIMFFGVFFEEECLLRVIVVVEVVLVVVG